MDFEQLVQAAHGQDLAHRLDRQLRGMYNVIVPVFFCVMGMLVDFEAISWWAPMRKAARAEARRRRSR